MSDPITISVTAEHIKNGQARRCQKCPIALAAQSVGLPGVHVGIDTIYWGTEPRMSHAALPPEANKFIQDFDNGKRPEPFSFSIALSAKG